MENNLTALICTCCGGKIEREKMICCNCGTQYKFDENKNLITVEQFNRNIIYLNGAFQIPAFYVKTDPEMAMQHILKEMAQNLAIKLLPLIEFQARLIPEQQLYMINAKIGVAEPFNYSGVIKKQYNFTSGEFWEG